MKRSKKFLALVLSVVTFFGVFSCSTPVFAQEITDALEHQAFIENAINNPTIVEDASEAEILYEVKEKRDEYTKVYKKDDGSYTAVMSKEPLHYLDDGVWEEINNSMILQGDLYTNTDNLFNVELPKNIDSNESLTVERDGYEISFSVEDIAESIAVVENNVVAGETSVTAADEAIAQTQSAITYSDIAENTDLQYIVTPDSIKENIIVSDKESVKDTYTFTFETNGLNTEKYDDGTVVFKDEAGEIKFRIPRPVMTDAVFAFSYDIDVVLVENEADTITLEYSPSMEWVNSTDRVYPINIDPAITFGNNNSTWVEDTYVVSDSLIESTKEEIYYNDTVGGVVDVTEDGGRKRYSEVYTKFDMDYFRTLGGNVVFSEVQYLFLGYATDGYAIAKEIATPIDLETVKYATKPELEDEVIDYYTSPYTGYENLPKVYMHFNITKPFNEWFNGAQNNGFAVVPGNKGFYSALILNGSSTDYYLSAFHRTYATIIVLDYVDMGGYNENFEYHAQKVSKAGTGYVNILTQQLTVIRDDVVAESNNIPVTISMIHNSAVYDKIKELNQLTVLAYGNNWVPSYLKAIFLMDENHLTYYTGEGGSLDFVRSTDSGGNIIFTEVYPVSHESSGYEVNYTPVSESILDCISVTTPDECVERFNEKGLLESVTKLVSAEVSTENGETTTEVTEKSVLITYDKTTYRIDYITDADGRRYDFEYDANTKLLSKINCYSTDNSVLDEIIYEYDDNKNLTSVTYDDGAVANYTYDSNSNITSNTCDGSTRVNYEYDVNGRVQKVTEQTFVATEFVGDSTISYERLNATQVKVTDAQNNYKIYSFDIKGKFLYTYNSITDSIVFEEDQNENVVSSIYTYSENYKLNKWKSSSGFERTEGNTEPVFEIQGGVDDETVLYQTINIIGKKDDEIVISGWFKGLFTKSQTDNTWLQGIIESDDDFGFNFTNDRLAQIEVVYQYTETDEEGNIDKFDDEIIIPFVENIDGWQLASERFKLKGNCREITVCVHYSKNANPASISCFELEFNGGYDLGNDANGKLTLKSGPQTVLSYEHNTDSKVTSMTYYNESNQQSQLTYEYTDTNKLSSISLNGKTKYIFKYDNNNWLESIRTLDNRIIRYIDYNIPVLALDVSPTYSDENQTYTYTETIGGVGYTTIINEDEYICSFETSTHSEGRDIYANSGKGVTINSVQDWYGRREGNTVQAMDFGTEPKTELAKVVSEYEYDDNKVFETMNDIKKYTNTVYIPAQSEALPETQSYSYEYDENGNIVEEYAYLSENSMVLRYSYEYNEQNQLVRYNDNVSEPKRSYTYTYDDSGNVSSKSIYAYAPLGTELDNPLSTEYYEYNEDDILIENNNEPITRDVNGNPISYDGATLVWTDNQLSSYSYTDEAGVEWRILYTYGEDGYISSKTIQKKVISSEDEQSEEQYEDIEKNQYTWAYGKLINQLYTQYDENGVAQQSIVIKFVYDSFDLVQGFIVDNTASYIYLKNLQGDIVGVVDESGNVVLSYEYDVWGAVTRTVSDNATDSLSSIVDLLPLAYRGFCYDYDTGLYFIGERFYNPNWGRFLDDTTTDSATGLPEFSNYDLFTYWENHPFWYMDNVEKEIFQANSIANYLNNKEVTRDFLGNDGIFEDEDNDSFVEGYIYSQRRTGIENYRYGVVISNELGCCWIATYNVAQMLGMELNPEDIIREYESYGLFLQGHHGIHPYAMARFFEEKNCDVKVSFNNFDDTAKAYEANIVYIKRNSIGHFVAVKYDGEDFYGYNTFCDNTKRDYLGEEISVVKKITEDGTVTRSCDTKIMISVSRKSQTTANS